MPVTRAIARKWRIDASRTLTAMAKPASFATPGRNRVCVNWMNGKDRSGRKRGRLLSAALRAVRGIRKARTQDLAEALGLSVRGYQNFEAGGGQLNVDHVLNFGAAIDCDPFGVLVSVQIGRPEFAAYVAQNKAMIAWLIALQEFVESTGEAIGLLETSTLLSAYRTMFKDLSGQALAIKADTDAWLAQNAGRLDLPKPPEGDEDS